MIYSTENIVLSLSFGVVLGIIYAINRLIKHIFGNKKTYSFILDFTFCVTYFVVTFILSLVTSEGRPRLIIILLQLLSFLCVLYVTNKDVHKVKKNKK